MEDPDSKEFLAIEPNELRFPFETGKQISCSLRLRNRTDECIAFKVRTTNPKGYCVQPNISIMPPRSTCDVLVLKQTLSEAPPDMLCKDKFLMQSIVVMEGTTIKDVTLEMFKKEAGNVVNEVKMKVVYVQPPGTPSPVLEGFEEGSSPHPSWSDGGDIYYQDDLGAFKEPKEISCEETSSLTEPTPSSSTSDSKETSSLTEPIPSSRTSDLKETSSLTEPLPRLSTSESEVWRMKPSEANSMDLLEIKPNELHFLIEKYKRSSCAMQLMNRTDGYIAFKVMMTNKERDYMVWPNHGIVPPRLACSVIVTRGARKEAPPHMQCMVKILVLSALVKMSTSKGDITLEMFNKDSGNLVNKVRLKAFCIQQPRPPSPVREGSDEDSSSSSSCSDWGNINCQDTASTLHSVQLHHLKDITNNFCNDRILGRGGFGVVYKGVLGNGEVIVVKKFVQSMSSSHEQFENEVNLLRKLDHKNIVRLLGFCYETQPSQKLHEGRFIFAWDIECLLCIEYLAKGSLDKYISDASSGLNWPRRFKIIEGISYGLQYLHEQSGGPIVHLDLKPGNILLDENMIPKITDFGLSRLFDQEQTIHTLITRGTLGYMSREYLRGIITPMSDIFSLGVLIMEVITGHRDYPDDIRRSSAQFIELELERWKNVLQQEQGYTSLETDCQQIRVCIQIGLICVNPERTRRPTMKKIIDMLQGLESMDCYIRNELTPLSAQVT